MLDPNDPLVQLKITSATCSVFALGTTIYRLYKRRGRYWADDFWALFASVCLVMQVVAVFLHVPIPNKLSAATRVSAYYLMATTFYAVIWASRLSILFSIIRIDPSPERRQRMYWVSLAFLGAAIILIAQLLWVCEPQPAWKKTPNPQCQLPLEVAVLQLVTDIIADSTLLFAPLPLFRTLFDKELRYKLTLIFSTCVVTTIVSLVHAAFILRNGGIKVVISALVEDCLSLIVANLPVLVTTMIDIVGEPERDPARTPFSTLMWFSAAHSVHSGEVPLYTIREEDADADVKSTAFSAVSSVRWNEVHPDPERQSTSRGTTIVEIQSGGEQQQQLSSSTVDVLGEVTRV
ncbi:hypothetical protein C8R46DRAFT_282393 [Mycena filopes]|nr:hypothetical protein C8R46DRAFT_282393 [Mycena filopes]